MAQEMELDIQELESLVAQAKRDKVRNLLQANLEQWRKEQQQQTIVAQRPTPATTTPSPTPAPLVVYSPVPSYAWDQDDDTVKLYVSIEGVGTLPSENINTSFQANSFDLRIHNLAGKNYRLHIDPLCHSIDPSKSKCIVRPSRVTVVLKKDTKQHWLSLEAKREKFKPKFDSKDDPAKGLMDLVRNLYEEGDEEMKRTIAKAWTEGAKKREMGGIDF